MRVRQAIPETVTNINWSIPKADANMSDQIALRDALFDLAHLKGLIGFSKREIVPLFSRPRVGILLHIHQAGCYVSPFVAKDKRIEEIKCPWMIWAALGYLSSQWSSQFRYIPHM